MRAVREVRWVQYSQLSRHRSHECTVDGLFRFPIFLKTLNWRDGTGDNSSGNWSLHEFFFAHLQFGTEPHPAVYRTARAHENSNFPLGENGHRHDAPKANGVLNEIAFSGISLYTLLSPSSLRTCPERCCSIVYYDC